MKDRTGSSLPALKQWILAHYPDIGGPRFNSNLNKALRGGLASKPPKLIKVRASYKVSPEFLASTAKKRSSATGAMSNAPGKGPNEAEEAQKRAEIMKKRHYPMEDTKLHAQDKQLHIRPNSKPRPTLPYFWQATLPRDHPHRSGKTPGGILSGSRVDAPLESRGLVPDLLQVYHFFRGDLHFVLDPNQPLVPEFTLQHLMFAVEQLLNGNVRKSKQVPPLLVHLFVTALQILLSGQGLTSSREESHLYTELYTYLASVLTPANWADVTHLYMDAMERYFAGVQSDPPVPDVGFTVSSITSGGGYLGGGALWRGHMKLGEKDPWFLSAEELMALLRALTDDILALFPDMLNQRDEELEALLKEKRNADVKLRKIRLAYEGPPPKKSTGKKDSDNAESNGKPFKPTATKKQFENAKKTQEKATAAYEEALSSLSSKTEPIGYDRNFNAVYSCSPHDASIIIVEDKRPATGGNSRLPSSHQQERRMWHVIETTSLFDQYIASLDSRGKREHDLKKALEPLREYLIDDIEEKKRQRSTSAKKAKLERDLEVAKDRHENGRSGRMSEHAEEDMLAARKSLDELEQLTPAKSDVPFDYVELTGLIALREFDQGGPSKRRKRSKKADSEVNRLPCLKCSKLCSTGDVDGTGMVGMIVKDILDVEEHCQSIIPWERTDKGRQNWISKVQGAVHAWNSISPDMLVNGASQMNGEQVNNRSESASLYGSPNGMPRRTSNGRRSDSPGAVVSGEKVSTILYMLRQPLLDLEERVAELTNVLLAARDSDLADDNMSVDEDPATESPKVEEWKRFAHKIRQTPSKKYGQVRQLLVHAISSARKAHLPTVVSRLRAALLLYHPSAAGECKAATIKVLEDFGNYEEDDDEEEDAEVAKSVQTSSTEEDSIPSVLSAEAVILRSSLAGSEDAKREDWANAVRSAKTLSRFASLSAGFVQDAMARIDKLEVERQALLEALVEWKKESAPRKGRKKNFVEPSEVWTMVDYTNDLCMAKAEDYPWWPARKCFPKDPEMAASLTALDRCIVAFVGEMGGLRVVKANEHLQPFTGKAVPEDGVTYTKDMRGTLDECLQMARRMQRGIQNGSSKYYQPIQSTNQQLP